MQQVKIRKSTFETNSSSMHTLVLANTSGYYSEKRFKNMLTDDGYLEIGSEYDRNFGREFRILDTIKEKIYYVLAQYGYYDLDVVVDAIKKFTPEFKGFKFFSDQSVVIANEEEKDTDVPCARDSYDIFNLLFGQIDHQSDGMIHGAIDTIKNELNMPNAKESDIVYEILFNKEFVIIVDSDESDHFSCSLAGGSYPGLYKKVLREHWYEEDGEYKSVYNFITIEEEIADHNSNYNEEDGDE